MSVQNRIYYSIDVIDLYSHERGCFLHQGDYLAVSPVFANMVQLELWAARNGYILTDLLNYETTGGIPVTQLYPNEPEEVKSKSFDYKTLFYKFIASLTVADSRPSVLDYIGEALSQVPESDINLTNIYGEDFLESRFVVGLQKALHAKGYTTMAGTRMTEFYEDGE